MKTKLITFENHGQEILKIRIDEEGWIFNDPFNDFLQMDLWGTPKVVRAERLKTGDLVEISTPHAHIKLKHPIKRITRLSIQSKKKA